MGVILIFLASCLWAADTLIRYPLIYGGLSATKLVFAEHFLLVLGLSPLFFINKKIWPKVSKDDLISFAFIGGLGSALATLAFTKAFSLLNPSLVILLQKFQPLVAISLAHFVLREPLKKEFLSWALLCVLGGLFISAEDISSGLKIISSGNLPFEGKSLGGYFLTFVAVLGWGAATVFGKKLSLKGYKETQLMFGRFAMGFLFLIPAVLSESEPIITGGDIWSKIVFMVLLSGFLGMAFYYQGLKRIPARLSALAEMFFPFCAIGVNWIFLEAKLTVFQLVGGLLLLIGSAVLQLKRY